MQTVPSGFNALADGDVRPLSWGLFISFSKAYDDDITFFTLDQSILDGPDILAPTEDNPLQAWDFYEYIDYSDRVIYLSWERELDFPYSIVSAIADFQVNNYDKFFTPHSASPISADNIPKRPVRLLSGFANTLLPQFVGLTQGMPEVDEGSRIATFTALDFLTQIYDLPIRNTIAMSYVTTDVVLANIFEQFGLAPTQYDLATGRNVIPFLFFEKNQFTAGEVIRALMQAEMGMLWLDELGIIRFRPRLEQPETSSYLFNDENINSIATSGDDEIINKVTITTNVREVQEFQVVYSKDASNTTLNVVPAMSSYVFQAELRDPCLTIEEPEFGEAVDVSWFTAETAGGVPVTSNVTVTLVELKTNTYEVTIANTNAFSININQMELWGQPAKEISVEPVIYENLETDSVAKYEVKELQISNNFIQSIDQARSLALTILDEYAEYADIVEIEVKGNPALQLSDIVEIDYQHYSGEYRIIAIKNKLQDQKFTQILKLRGYNPRQWFTLDQSVLDGTDVLAP